MYKVILVTVKTLTNIYVDKDFDEDAVLAEKSTTLSCPTMALRDTRDRPHLMFVMRHDIEPQGEDLLRGEVLTIAAVMITRLEESTEHK